MNFKFALILTFLLLLALVFTFNTSADGSTEAVYIRADGSIDPPAVNITSFDNVTYAFTSDVTCEYLAIERDSIVIDGRGYKLQSEGLYPEISEGMRLVDVRNVTIQNMTIEGCRYGVSLTRTSNSTISGCNITRSSAHGIWLDNSSYNMINGNNISRSRDRGLYVSSHSDNNTLKFNNITENFDGIYLLDSPSNIICDNYIDNNRYGIMVSSSTDNAVYGNILTNNYIGLKSFSSSANRVSVNNITNNDFGVRLSYSNSDTLSQNNIDQNTCGIYLEASTYGTIFRNNMTNNDRGLESYGSHDNMICENNITNSSSEAVYMLYYAIDMFFHNNLGNNAKQAVLPSFSIYSNWNDTTEGNYWSDYNGTDDNQDGMGDTPYVIDETNQDNYPLMGIFSDFGASSECHVQTICNSSVTDLQFNGTAISFNVSGENDTTGFCRICIPTALMKSAYKVFVNGTEVSYNLLPCSNETHSYLYFNYTHSTEEVIIIPESPSFLVLPLFMIATLLTAIVYRNRKVRYEAKISGSP